jgi:hypothetical protein
LVVYLSRPSSYKLPPDQRRYLVPGQYPFIVSNNKIEPLLSRIRTATKPERLTMDLLTTWGFPSSNDRAMPRLLRALGFLTESSQPTAQYDRLRDPRDYRRALGDSIRATYADLFSIDPNIHKAPDDDVRAAMSRITGKDIETVKRYFSTFKTLVSLADLEPLAPNAPLPTSAPSVEVPAPPSPPAPASQHVGQAGFVQPRKSEYHYNIQIHLPVTTDITVYNAIFKSLRDNLGV